MAQLLWAKEKQLRQHRPGHEDPVRARRLDRPLVISVKYHAAAGHFQIRVWKTKPSRNSSKGNVVEKENYFTPTVCGLSGKSGAKFFPNVSGRDTHLLPTKTKIPRKPFHKWNKVDWPPLKNSLRFRLFDPPVPLAVCLSGRNHRRFRSVSVKAGWPRSKFHLRE